ncbi:unnamed protein product [Closterium sp. NIES-64]|nr:unnamed protein product [Closterium sp. NIES-64]
MAGGLELVMAGGLELVMAGGLELVMAGGLELVMAGGLELVMAGGLELVMAGGLELVMAGGLELVMAGGLELVMAGGLELVMAGGLELVMAGGLELVMTGGLELVMVGGLELVMAGGLELVMAGGLELVMAGGLELVMAGGLELVMAGGLELVMAGGLELVMAGGLEFYPLAGDPKVLAEYMVKNKGFLPSSSAEVVQQWQQLESIIFSTWPACTHPDLASNGTPFRADAIIANPPVYGTCVPAIIAQPSCLRSHHSGGGPASAPSHVLHMAWRYALPWSMTAEYPRPLAGEMPAYTGYENQLSYVVVEGLMWLGVRDFINSFRKKLKLPPILLRNHPKMRIPFGYIRSPTLAPKPHDWGNPIDVVGFCFLNLADHYSPPAYIQQFLDSGPAPVFIGFGSLPVSDPKGLTQKLVEALQRRGQRGILQEGWGELGKMEAPNPNVLVIGNCPHDWLFPRCRAVLHHGGAGTTAAGLNAGPCRAVLHHGGVGTTAAGLKAGVSGVCMCPTTIIPFFGDQPFWGASVHAAGVGPEPIPIGALTLDRIVAAIEFMIRAEVVAAARELAGLIAREDRVDGAVQAFHKHLPPGFQSQQHCTPWLEASPSGRGDYWGECAWWLWSFWGDAEEEEAEEGSSLPQKVGRLSDVSHLAGLVWYDDRRERLLVLACGGPKRSRVGPGGAAAPRLSHT